MNHLVLIAHNLRSAHNVGSLMRTCEGLGVEELYLTGYTPYPSHSVDQRLPHIAQKITKQIHKTALGAESMLKWQYHSEITEAIQELKNRGYAIAAIEQTGSSVQLPEFRPPEKLALIVGRETEGIETEILELCETVVEIPMLGRKESFNVVQAAAMVLYHCRYF